MAARFGNVDAVVLTADNGDLIAFSRTFYNHWAVYIGDRYATYDDSVMQFLFFRQCCSIQKRYLAEEYFSSIAETPSVLEVLRINGVESK